MCANGWAINKQLRNIKNVDVNIFILQFVCVGLRMWKFLYVDRCKVYSFVFVWLTDDNVFVYFSPAWS